MAFSLAAGVQWNYAKEIFYDDQGRPVPNADGSLRTLGHIPSIKVFRLDGYDSIRGFTDEEVNRLLSGKNINELRIQDRVYFTSLKIEPRYYPQDHVAFGIFFDAGGLFVRHYKPLKLRTSVGFGLKFLTPVGTLDFDYGVKLKRHTFEGEREKIGRFHLSVGYF